MGVTYDGATVAVVVPAYNESGLVGGVIETVPDYVDRVYVVEDGSTDDTWAEIRTTAKRINAESPSGGEFDRRVVPIRHEENRGVGGAIKTGYLAARDDRIDVTAVMGGDAQMRPELLAGVIDPIVADEADYVKGNRLLNADHREGMPRFRYVGNRILTWLTRIASGYWTIGDPQNGYTAISLHALETAGIEEMYEYYGYCNDLLVRCNVAGLRVMDVPRPANYGEEESHIDYRSYVPKVSVMLFRGFLRRLWRKHVRADPHPMVGLYGASAAGALYAAHRAVRSEGTSGLGRAAVVLLTAGLCLVAALTLDRNHDAALGRRRETLQRPEPTESASTPATPVEQD
ncbi:glycosyltransferase family 2 protein [Halomicroarcula sp. F28]|uniref:Glycosyltransferase family 2 protein n=1 Tax=Haloarcula salinisoli TaxID=2487746 RepID=A0A8J7YKY3_9EURY|nr:glycosyltransferase family 2 protein [Halomicroarcula salinisoli]MBX0285453.1 glycosyltransferase family 2 protein [Halomicroarcula salinisoli]MBX0303068.1 glycosyltransferase family 2 protein [Halomicroarcula salinisoli]